MKMKNSLLHTNHGLKSRKICLKMKISCLNAAVLKANRTEESKNNDPTIPNLPLPIKVEHPPKKVKKSITSENRRVTETKGSQG